MADENKICPECDNTKFEKGRCTQCFHTLETGEKEKSKDK